MSSKASFIGIMVAVVVAVVAVALAVFVVLQDVNRNSTEPAAATSSTSRITVTEPAHESSAAPSSEQQVTTTAEQTAEPTSVETSTAAPASSEQPYEGKPCDISEAGQVSADGTLVCSMEGGAWKDRTSSFRPPVARGSSCSEPGARARVARTDGIATCKAGPDGTLVWDF